MALTSLSFLKKRSSWDGRRRNNMGDNAMNARNNSFLLMTSWMAKVLLISLMLNAIPAYAQQAVSALNIPQIISANVTPGLTKIDLPVLVGGTTSLQFQVIAPVNGVTLTVINPANQIVFAPNDPSVSYLPGSELQPTQAPGAQFITPVVSNPANGTWIVRVQFPAATEKTVILLTTYIESSYQVGFALDAPRHNKGDQISIGLLAVNNGTPISNLSPSISVSAPNGQKQTLTGLDNGNIANLDGLANDGLYSVGYLLDQIGQYQLDGSVTIPTPSGNIVRTATAFIDVAQSQAALNSVETIKQSGTAGCVAGVDVVLHLSILQDRYFVGVVKLKGSNGSVIEESRGAQLAPGNQTITVPFTSKEIQALNVDGPYSVDVEVLDYSGEAALLALSQSDAASLTDILLSNLCRSPIEIKPPLVVAPTLKSGFIGSLSFSFGVDVVQAGSYQFSFKLLGSGGKDVGVISFSQYLPSGSNVVQTNVPASKFLNADGPYRAVSLLVIGGQSNAQLADLGNTNIYKRWQFYPNITGDLDNDGDVDLADRALLLTYRGQKALNPGDQRNIKRDGVIDLLDGNAITGLYCKVGKCAVNP